MYNFAMTEKMAAEKAEQDTLRERKKADKKAEKDRRRKEYEATQAEKRMHENQSLTPDTRGQ